MVRSSSQIGMACAVMERPQESATKPKHLPRGLLRNFFPQVNWLFPLTIKVKSLVLHNQSLHDNPPIQIKRALPNWSLVQLTHKYIPLTSVMFKYVMKSFLNWGLFPFNLKVNYPKYKLLFLDALGFMWYLLITAKHDGHRCLWTLGGSR